MSHISHRIGRVLNTFDDDTAEVMTERKSACGGCQDTRNCKTCLTGSDKIVAVVKNDAGACPGDMVKIEHKKDALLGGAALFYIFPVITLLTGSFAGGAVSAGRGIDESSGAILVGLAGLVVGWLLVAGFARTNFARVRLVPRIVGIIEGDPSKSARVDSGAIPQESSGVRCG